MKKPSSPTLQDVADRASVSSATVSRFFSRRELVSEKTAARIQEAVSELGYLPNLLAGGLASKRTRLVAILVPALSESPFSSMIEAIVAALASEGYTAMLAITGEQDQNLQLALDAALGRRAEAIILTGIVADDATRARFRDSDTRVIETWGLPAEPIDCAVGFSHAAVGEATADYIHARGYSRPLIITATGTRAFERRSGFVNRWSSLTGGKFEEIEVSSPSNFSQARAVFRKLKSSDSHPDVVVAGSDGMAQGLIVEALNAGISIPDQLAIMGFGNRPIARGMRPSITTVAIDGDRIGKEAARLLQHTADGEISEHTIVDVGFQIIARESA